MHHAHRCQAHVAVLTNAAAAVAAVAAVAVAAVAAVAAAVAVIATRVTRSTFIAAAIRVDSILLVVFI